MRTGCSGVSQMGTLTFVADHLTLLAVLDAYGSLGRCCELEERDPVVLGGFCEHAGGQINTIAIMRRAHNCRDGETTQGFL